MTTDLHTLKQAINMEAGTASPAFAEQLERLQKHNRETKNLKMHRPIPPGFDGDSEMFKLAQEAGLPLFVVDVSRQDPYFGDMFAEQITVTYEVDWESLFALDFLPRRFGGDDVKDAINSDDAGEVDERMAVAWDETEVAFTCPRGHVCSINRECWEKGRRYCLGC